MHSIVALLTFWVGLLTSVATAAESLSDLSITVDATKVTEQAVDRLVTEAYPIEYEISESETIRVAVERQCARISPLLFSELRSRFFELNPSLVVAAKTDVIDAQILGSTAFVGPFCFRQSSSSAGLSKSYDPYPDWGTVFDWVGHPVAATALSFDTDPNWHTGLSVGTSITPWQSTSLTGQDFSGDERGRPPYSIDPMDPDEEFANDSVTSLSTTITLKRGDAATTVAMLAPARLLTAAAPQVDDAEDRGQLVAIEDIGDKPCEVPVNAASTRVAEFDPAGILNAMALNELLRSERDERGGYEDSTVVSLADSGLFLATSPVFSSSRVVGVKSDPREDYQFAPHGTQVAALVLGGFELALANSLLLTKKTGIKMSNLVVKRPTSTGHEFAIDEPSLLGALKDANDKSRIINMSVRFPKKIEGFETYKDSRRALIVVAAGNSSRNLNAHEAYPAKEGGSDNETVITVAALERNGTIAPFSNRGANFVDIAALGCNVLTWDYDTVRKRLDKTRVSGTSFAAPMVSAVAAWLKSQNSEFKAADLKQRIIVSADIEDALSDSVRHGRILNAYKALRSLHADVVEIEQDGMRRLFTGRLLNPLHSMQWKIGGEFYDEKNLLKVARYKSENQAYIIYTRKDGSEDMADPGFANLLFSQTSIELEDALTRNKQTIATSSIRDIVFARAPYWGTK